MKALKRVDFEPSWYKQQFNSTLHGIYLGKCEFYFIKNITMGLIFMLAMWDLESYTFYKRYHVCKADSTIFLLGLVLLILFFVN